MGSILLSPTATDLFDQVAPRVREQHLDLLEPRGKLRGDEGQQLGQALARFPRDADRGVWADSGNSAHLAVGVQVNQGEDHDSESVEMTIIALIGGMPTVLHN